MNPVYRQPTFGWLVEFTGLPLWMPGQPVPSHAKIVLAGASAWSGYDAECLKTAAEARVRCQSLPQLFIYDLNDLAVGATRPVFTVSGLPLKDTPLVSVWENGSLVREEQGYTARLLLMEIYESKNHRNKA